MTKESDLAQAVQQAEKPDLTLAMEIAQMVKSELHQSEQRTTGQIRELGNLVATTSKRITDLESKVDQRERAAEQSRRERAEKELKEAETRYALAKEQKDGLTTDEKIEVAKVMEERTRAAEQARTDRRRAFWQDKVMPALVIAVLVSIVGPVGLGVFIAILVFILRALGIDVQWPS